MDRRRGERQKQAVFSLWNRKTTGRSCQGTFYQVTFVVKTAETQVRGMFKVTQPAWPRAASNTRIFKFPWKESLNVQNFKKILKELLLKCCEVFVKIASNRDNGGEQRKKGPGRRMLKIGLHCLPSTVRWRVSICYRGNGAPVSLAFDRNDGLKDWN